MPKLGCFFLTLGVFIGGCALVSSGIASDINITDTYSVRSVGGVVYYSKLEQSGCTTSLNFRKGGSAINLAYGECNIEKGELETVKQIAGSFANIVDDNKLGSIFRERKYLTLNISWKISHWPLINAVNVSESWPTNLSAEYKDGSLNGDEFRVKYKGLLQKEILKETVYLPFVDSVKKMGCSISLSDDFADPLFLPGKSLTKSKLIKWGVYRSDEVNKVMYPFIKGSVKFDFLCK